MKIQINEVWNNTGDSKQLAIIDVSDYWEIASEEVHDWVRVNRPDLAVADSLFSHGFHAKQIN